MNHTAIFLRSQIYVKGESLNEERNKEVRRSEEVSKESARQEKEVSIRPALAG